MPDSPKVEVAAKIVPHLWFAENAVEAAHHYVSLLPGSRVDRVTSVPAETPSSWQIVPRVLGELMTDADRNRSRRVMEALLRMKKIDIAELRRAHAGKE